MVSGFDKLIVKITDSSSTSDLAHLVGSSRSQLKSILERLGIEASLDQVHDGILTNSGGKSFMFMDLKNETNPYLIGSNIGARLRNLPIDKVACILHQDDSEILKVIEACMLRYPSFVQYQSKQNQKPKEITFIVNDKSSIEKHLTRISHIVDSVLYSRRLINLPSNHKRPSDMASEAYKLEDLKVKCKVLQGEDIKDMQCLTAVGQASSDKSKLIVLEWIPKPGGDVIALVGKGVTFDSGGLSVKPAKSMETMKSDMAGGATVMGIIRAAAQMQLEHNLVAIIPCAENMISGDSVRPGDIVKSYSGHTVEILNTDAEGRLILADALSYVQSKYSPPIILDFATLTGAIAVALGNIYTGLFSNNDDLAKVLIDAGHRSWERVWRLPLDREYNKALDSPIADMKNIGAGDAGAIIGAEFLQRFVNNGVKWAHLDIAGTAFSEKSSIFAERFATGICIRSILDALDELSDLMI